jgi:hypothetical protein
LTINLLEKLTVRSASQEIPRPLSNL